MVENVAELVVGASGAVHVAPVGTALPTDIATALNAAFKNTGLLTEDGVGIEPAMEQTVLYSWQRLTRVRTIVTRRDIELTFAMQQWNETNIPLAFGGGTVTPTAGPPAYYTYAPLETQVRDPRSMVVEWADGSKLYRVVFPEVEVTDLAGFTLSKSAESALAVTANAVAGNVAGYTWRLITNDPNFAV